MTGAYLRVRRGNKWQNIEIEYLSDGEREELFKESSTEELLKWLNFMCSEYQHLVLAVINKMEGEEERNE